jgi:hypothetical protein
LVKPFPEVERVWLANRNCKRCDGAGLTKRRSLLCACVALRVWKSVWDTYQELAVAESEVRYSRGTFVRPTQEYLADFLAIAKQELTPFEFRAMCRYYLQDVPVGSQNRSDYHFFERIAVHLGRAHAQREDGLYPLQRYFGGVAPFSEIKVGSYGSSKSKNADTRGDY